MSPGLVLFTGAPTTKSLNWNPEDLLDTLNGAVARFAGLDGDTTDSLANSTHPQWRSLPLERQRIAAGLGLTQSFDQHQLFTGYSHDEEGASLFTTSEVESSISQFQLPGDSIPSTQASRVLTQFYEESYARHEDIPSSQIAPASDVAASFASDEFSFASDSFGSPSQLTQKSIPIAGHLSNVRDIPKAVYINSIQPQTMTVNLIVGIISAPPARSIKTRRGANVSLIELLVGDETKSGFGINFWLSSSQPAEGDMLSVLEGLRPQDVVLMRNVALSSFRQQVYGQSLRKEMTKVHLLYRNRVDKMDVGGCYSAAELVGGGDVLPQVEKTRRVREWVMKFVGVGAGKSKGKGKAIEAVNETLPPDTQ